MSFDTVDARKRAAAEKAAAEVENGMLVGLGTGSTAFHAVAMLGARVREGLRITGIPTSNATADEARRQGIPLTELSSQQIDITIDGADQVALTTFDLVKGLGGALLREKIVAAASRRMIVIVDDSKVADELDGRTALPVEIVQFGWRSVVHRLAQRGHSPRLRMAGDKPFVTDGGNYIVDCAIGLFDDPVALNDELSTLPGVVETGLFIDLATDIIIGRATGVEILRKQTVKT